MRKVKLNLMSSSIQTRNMWLFWARRRRRRRRRRRHSCRRFCRRRRCFRWWLHFAGGEPTHFHIRHEKRKSNTRDSKWCILSLKSYSDYIGVILGLYWDYIGVILGLYWGYIGVICRARAHVTRYEVPNAQWFQRKPPKKKTELLTNATTLPGQTLTNLYTLGGPPTQ